MEFFLDCIFHKIFQDKSLAVLHLIRSKFIFDSLTNGNKDVGLVSHEISAQDSRYFGKTTQSNFVTVLIIRQMYRSIAVRIAILIHWFPLNIALCLTCCKWKSIIDQRNNAPSLLPK